MVNDKFLCALLRRVIRDVLQRNVAGSATSTFLCALLRRVIRDIGLPSFTGGSSFVSMRLVAQGDSRRATAAGAWHLNEFLCALLRRVIRDGTEITTSCSESCFYAPCCAG